MPRSIEADRRHAICFPAKQKQTRVFLKLGWHVRVDAFCASNSTTNSSFKTAFVCSHRTHTKRLLLLHNQLANSTSKYIYTPPTATTMDSVKSTINDKMALLRSKLDQIPALQEVEVSLQRHYVMYK
jgi:hypothetical protein